MSGFRLYPKEQHWWSFTDYQAVLDVMQELGPRRVLEFGPGSSTLALIEGGATSIDTCEDDCDWYDVYQKRLVAQFPAIVRAHLYVWRDPLTIPALDEQRYDLALIDGPHSTELRPAVLRYALARCRAVLIPTEEYRTQPTLRQSITAIAADAQRSLTIKQTGPLSGAFALIGGPVC